jgi:hypothetical protein
VLFLVKTICERSVIITTNNSQVHNDFSSSPNGQNPSRRRDPDGLEDRGELASQMAPMIVREVRHRSMMVVPKPEAQPARSVVMAICVIALVSSASDRCVRLASQ